MDLNVLVTAIHLFRSPDESNFQQIHGTGFFLPWHRLYVQAFEDALRTKCNYWGVQPYWDWTKGNTPSQGSPAPVLI